MDGKCCNKCRQYKALEGFGRQLGKIRSICKECINRDQKIRFDNKIADKIYVNSDKEYDKDSDNNDNNSDNNDKDSDKDSDNSDKDGDNIDKKYDNDDNNWLEEKLSDKDEKKSLEEQLAIDRDEEMPQWYYNKFCSNIPIDGAMWLKNKFGDNDFPY